jgi:hypothetical protein
LYEILDAIPPRNIEAVKALLLALTDPSYNTAAVTSQPKTKPTEDAIPAAFTTNTPDITNEPVKAGKFSVGGGAFFDWNLKSSVVIADYEIGYNLMSIGAYGFLDTKFFELSIGPSFGMGTSNKVGINTKINLLQLDIIFLGKLPIDLPGGKFSIFPMLGISYNQPLFKINGDSITTSIFYLGQLGLLGGVGLDYNLTSALYLRGEGMFHLRAPYWETIDITGQSGTKFNLGMGPRIRLGVGYRL